MLELRQYQQECVDLINNTESGSALISMATGLGKTVVFSRINRRGRVLIISHREELVHQPLKYYDCKCGVEQGNETSNGEQVVSASIQSLIRRLDKFKPDDFDVIITDEAHHAAAPSYKKAYEYFKPRLHLGFTATPNRGDKVRLDDVFEKILFERNLKWGILNGYLSDIRCLRVRVSTDLRKVKRQMGDFSVSDLDKAVNNEIANTEVADVYKKYASGQTLIFATSVAHATNIAKLIKGAVVVSQKTQNRKQIIDDFTARKIPCIVNCMIFTEGTDIPLIETIIIARPTQNPSLYTQMVGRGLRLSKGKQFLTLIDCVGVTDKLDICTAPTLMGLDLDSVPDYRRDNVEGMLTEMSEIIDKAADCAETWLLNVNAVNLFAREQGVNTHSINWTKKSNGDLVYQFACGDRIGIKAINELGKTKLMLYAFDEQKNKFVYTESPETTLNNAINDAFELFSSKYIDEKRFWNLDSYYAQVNKPATEKQLQLIKNQLQESEWKHLQENKELSCGDAGQIINALNIRNLTPSRLLKMHQKSIEEKKQREQELEIMQKLKIRTLINPKRTTRKYYAIMHPTDLVVTNDWSIASELIAEIDSKNEIKCRFKGFSSIDQAKDFLRGKEY